MNVLLYISAIDNHRYGLQEMHFLIIVQKVDIHNDIFTIYNIFWILKIKLWLFAMIFYYGYLILNV